jgi:CRISPR-associated protein Csh1
VLKSTYDIGQIVAKGKDETQMYITDIGDAYIHELAIILIKNGETLQYSGCEKREKTRRNYLFREKKGNIKIPISLTLRDAGKGAEVILEKFINFGEHNKTPIASKVASALLESKVAICTSLDEMAGNLPKKEGRFYTVVIREADRELYPGDLDEFKEIFLRNIVSMPSDNTGICFVCGEEKGIGMKASDIFKFASFDKPGFAHEMDDKNYYVNMPLCEDCFSKISLGKRVLDEELSMNFYASKVYIIPRFHSSDNELLEEKVNEIRDIKRISDLKDTVRKDNPYRNFETYMLYDISEGSYSTLNFIFYTVNNQEMKINLSILDVPPSRLRNMSRKISDIEGELRNVFGTQEYSPSVLFGSMYDVFKDNRLRTFFDYIEALFKNQPVSLTPLKRGTLELIGSKKLRGEPYATKAKQLITIALFIERLQQNVEGGIPLMEKDREDRIKEFFEKYPAFFRTDEEKFLFILGQIHSRIARFQREKNIASTVDLKLKAYNMRPLDFMNHFKDLKWKTTQYSNEMDFTRVYGPIMNLFQIADKYLIPSGYDWKASIEDLNYAFLAGELATGVFRRETDQLELETDTVQEIEQ